MTPVRSSPRNLVIAIDGPSGVGKGTVARAIARALGYRHVDTGAMYRAVAWQALERGIALDDEEAVSAVAEASTLAFVEDGEGSGPRVLINGTDVTRDVRTPRIDQSAAAVARMPRVRAALVKRQRELGEAGGIVMEGRDIGTVVFPAADVKIFLDAAPVERARRRANDSAHGSARPLGEVAGALAERDRLDTTRATSPLKPAADAVCIDTTDVPAPVVIARVLAIVTAR